MSAVQTLKKQPGHQVLSVCSLYSSLRRPHSNRSQFLASSGCNGMKQKRTHENELFGRAALGCSTPRRLRAFSFQENTVGQLCAVTLRRLCLSLSRTPPIGGRALVDGCANRGEARGDTADQSVCLLSLFRTPLEAAPRLASRPV